MKFLFLSFALMVSGTVVTASGPSGAVRVMATIVDINGGIKTALDIFSLDCERFPTTSEGFKALLNCPTNIPAGKWHGPYLAKVPQDPWGHDYVYVYPGVHNTNGFDLYSRGFDGISKSGGDDLDDINNWDLLSPRIDHYYSSYGERFIDKTIGIPTFSAIILTLLLISFLGWVWIIAAIFSRHVRASITRHRTLLIIWVVVTLAVILRVLVLWIPRISG